MALTLILQSFESSDILARYMATFVMAADLSGDPRVLCKTPTGQLSGTYNSRRDETPGPSYSRCKHSPYVGQILSKEKRDKIKEGAV